MLINIKELAQTELGNFVLEISFDDLSKPYQIELEIAHHAKAEENLEWYFERYLDEPFIAQSKIEQTVQN